MRQRRAGFAWRVAGAATAAVSLVLTAAAPALAAQPYPVNFKTFSLAAADASRTGTVVSGGSVTLAATV